ncbi:MAG: hypothetical protein ACTSYA_12460 [Candidatus Kariarchaeaceae archaeon]
MKRNNTIYIIFVTCLMLSSLIQPTFADYGFKTPTSTARILEHDIKFDVRTRSYVILDIYSFSSATNAKFAYSMGQYEADYYRHFTIYFKPTSSSTWVEKKTFTRNVAFYYGGISLGPMSANTHYQIKIEIYGGYWADHWYLKYANVDECNVGLIKVETPGGDFIPENARIDDSYYRYFSGLGSAKIKYTTDLTAPPHFFYGTTNGLEKYIINCWTDADGIGSAGVFNELRIRVRELKYTVSIRMTDNTNGDLTAITCNSIKTAHSSEVDYNSVDWSIDASIGGTYGSVGTSFSLRRGDDLTHHAKSLTPSGTGSGNWRQLGYVHYKFNSGADRKIASDFELVAPSYAMDYLNGHNIQIKIDVWTKSGVWNTWWNYWTSSYATNTNCYYLGDGCGSTMNQPTSYADTFITCMLGELDLSS